MSDDLQATISANLGNTLQALDQVNKRLDAIVKTSEKATSRAKDAQSQFSRTLKQGGEAASKAGGMVGSVGGRILGGAGIDGNMGRVAAGLGLAALAYSAFNKVIEARIDRTQKLIDAEKDLRTVHEQADATEKAQALRGATQATPNLRSVIALGAERGGGVSELERSGLGSTEQAAAAIAAILKSRFTDGATSDFREGSSSRRALNYTKMLGSVGVPIDQAASQITAGGMQDPEMVRRRAARIYQRHAGLTGGDAEQQLQDALGNVGKSDYLNAADQTNEQLGRMPGLDRSKTIAGGQAAAMETVAQAIAPLAAGMTKLFQQQQQQLSDLGQLATAQGKVLGLLADVFQPQGSFETQIRRLQNAQAGAMQKDR